MFPGFVSFNLEFGRHSLLGGYRDRLGRLGRPLLGTGAGWHYL